MPISLDFSIQFWVFSLANKTGEFFEIACLYLIALLPAHSHSIMPPQYIQVVLALLLVMPNQIMALLVPRQTAFSNDTSTPTSTSGQATAIPTPPPCCWIVLATLPSATQVGTRPLLRRLWVRTRALPSVLQRADGVPKPLL